MRPAYCYPGWGVEDADESAAPEMIAELDAKRQVATTRRNYADAESTRLSLKSLRQTTASRQMLNMKSRHTSERLKLQELHLPGVHHFNATWQMKQAAMNAFEVTTLSAFQVTQMSEKRQFHFKEDMKWSRLRAKYSSHLLALRKQENTLAKQQL